MFRFFLIVFLFSGVAKANDPLPKELEGIGIQENLGQKVSLDLSFKDETGSEVTLQKYFDGKKPVIVTLVYYGCPNLCTFLLNGFLETLNKMEWVVGNEFRVVTVTIDPDEEPKLAATKKENYLKEYQKTEEQKKVARENWAFLTGREENIKKLADTLGFKYKYQEESKEYAHSAGIFILTPDGKISRSLHGIEFKPFDLKMALLEAGEGKIGTTIDRLVMFCFHYNPKDGQYSLAITQVLKLVAVVTVLGVVFLIFMLGKNRKTGVQRV